MPYLQLFLTPGVKICGIIAGILLPGWCQYFVHLITYVFFSGPTPFIVRDFHPFGRQV